MSNRNESLFERAQQSIPGGVNSPVRAFRAVGGTPRFFARGEGPYFWDADGKRYIDYVCSWGPLILGHAHPDVVRAVQKKTADGLSFGAPTEIEIEMAELLCRSVPNMEMVRLVSSGTEATMSALRLARGHTGRHRIIKFEGCYHGHGDALLVKAGSGLLTLGQPTSAGVPPEVAAATTVLSYNDCAQLEAAFKELGNETAAVIVEPVAGNMNLVPATSEFLQTMRRLCTQYGAVLIFDEVMCGFRVHPRGAQALYGVDADLITLGKVIGGGMPVGAFGGRKSIMQSIAPLGPVYQAGTLSGNPVAVIAGLTTLDKVLQPGFHEALSARTTQLVEGLSAAAKSTGVAFSAKSVGSMFGVYFLPAAPGYYADVMRADKERFNRFFHAMLDRGVYFAPSAFEAGFVSAAHGEAQLQATFKAASEAFATLG